MEQAGFKVLWQAEWDKHCQSVLRRHWPDCTLYGDVTDVNGAEIAPVDVVTFGSPCQDLSVAGKRAGLDGDRSSMFFQAIRIIKEMRDATAGTFPRIAIWENVPGALSSNRGADFGVVLDSLANVGAMAIEWAVLDAQHFGVPQRRRRVFVVAVFDSVIAERCPDPLLPVAEGRRRNSAKGNKKEQEVAGTIGGGSGSRGRSPDTDRMTFVPETTGTLTSGGHPGSYNGQDAYSRAKDENDFETWVEGDVAPTLNAFDNAAETRATVVMPTIIFDSGSHGAPRESKDVVPTLTGRMGTGGNNTPLAAQPLVYDGYNQKLDDSGVHRTLRTSHDSADFVAQPIPIDDGREIEKHQNGLGIGTEGSPAYTLDTRSAASVAQPIAIESTGGSWGVNAGETSPPIKVGSDLGIASPPAVLTEYAVRRLTPLECERLMGWPDDHTRWTDDEREQADSHRYRQCGNGVASPVAMDRIASSATTGGQR
jgi:DNA (cytosine-5)-methyltransferase 1